MLLPVLSQSYTIHCSSFCKRNALVVVYFIRRDYSVERPLNTEAGLITHTPMSFVDGSPASEHRSIGGRASVRPATSADNIAAMYSDFNRRPSRRQHPRLRHPYNTSPADDHTHECFMRVMHAGIRAHLVSGGR